MNSEEILKTCVRELKRCGISFLLIIIGVFLATQNAPAATMPKHKQCMGSMEIINALTSRPVKSGTRALVQPVGNSLHRFHTKQTNSKCVGNLAESKASKQYR
ncbi:MULTISPECIES: hypothetical protein [Methylomonas]|uniref:Uncharacterized protein n=2 Tax=Methylomonas TaxID=416 RepID=A0A126T7T7_9GAMM|nr:MULTISPECIES: hypothetical protein [Methylomonas]AMK78147.1 hypothetical protein JT25_016935 [Methylomonas denitrificans]OAH96460.1 hypothetical protein A1342_02910 [Methylomonas methanica]TCV85684.1 hypothetical protein EDE11_105246 [Methylomonas methanica]